MRRRRVRLSWKTCCGKTIHTEGAEENRKNESLSSAKGISCSVRAVSRAGGACVGAGALRSPFHQSKRGALVVAPFGRGIPGLCDDAPIVDCVDHSGHADG